MKTKITNEDGTESEIEVSTKAEVDARVATEKAALEETHKKQLDEVTGKIGTFEQEKKDLQTKIDEMVKSGMNADNPSFRVLKEAMDKKDKDLGELKKTIDDDKSQRVKDEMDANIKIASKGNAEFEKKVRFHLEKTLPGLPEGTKAERETKLAAAFKLAADVSSDGPGMFDGGTGGGGNGGAGGKGEGNTSEFSSKEKALGAKLGLTDADYKKYGSRVSKR